MVKMYLIWKSLDIVLVHSNIVDNDYQQDPRVSYAFVSNKLFVFNKLLILQLIVIRYCT